MSKDKPDYEVGYGRPPQHGKFPKGKSGNPKGRPKKASEHPTANEGLLDLIGQEAGRLIALTENGRTQQISFTQALVKAMFNNASRSRLERKELFGMLLELENDQLNAKRETYDFWQREKHDALALITKYQSLGLPPPQRLPHPADIALNSADLSVRVVGPADTDDLPLYETMRTLRDYLSAKSELNMRRSKSLALAAENTAACAFGVLATVLNAKMPPSYVQTTSERVKSAW